MTSEFNNGSMTLGFSLGNVMDLHKSQRIFWLAERPFACQEGLCSTVSLLSSVIEIQTAVPETTTTTNLMCLQYEVEPSYSYINFVEELLSDNELYATCPLTYLYYTKLVDATLNTLFPLVPLPFPSFLFNIMPTCHETLHNSTQSRYIPHK
jgi:hypothetical protein